MRVSFRHFGGERDLYWTVDMASPPRCGDYVVMPDGDAEKSLEVVGVIWIPLRDEAVVDLEKPRRAPFRESAR